MASKPDTLLMLTSEIAVAEVNTLRDEITLIIPKEFRVDRVDSEVDGAMEIHVVRRD